MIKKIKEFIKAFKTAYNTINLDKNNARKAIDDYSKEVYDKEWRNNSPFNHLPLYQHKVIEFFHKHHFDYRGLIPMGLAIDATGKNIY